MITQTYFSEFLTLIKSKENRKSAAFTVLKFTFKRVEKFLKSMLKLIARVYVVSVHTLLHELI